MPRFSGILLPQSRDRFQIHIRLDHVLVWFKLPLRLSGLDFETHIAQICDPRTTVNITIISINQTWFSSALTKSERIQALFAMPPPPNTKPENVLKVCFESL